MRVVAAVTALIAVACTAWMLYQLRRWKIKHPEGDYQADEFILAWLVLTVRPRLFSFLFGKNPPTFYFSQFSSHVEPQKP